MARENIIIENTGRDVPLFKDFENPRQSRLSRMGGWGGRMPEKTDEELLMERVTEQLLYDTTSDELLLGAEGI